MIPDVVYHPPTDWVNPSEPLSGPAFPVFGNISHVYIHYEGLPESVAPPATDAQMIARLRNEQHDYITGRGYSLGYGYSTPPDGSVWGIRQFDFRNAANAGRKVEGNANHWSLSIQLKVRGQGEATQAQIAAVQAIVAETRRQGAPAEIGLHQHVDYTTCPGAGIISQFQAGLFEPTGDDMTQDQLDQLLATIVAASEATTDALVDLTAAVYDLPAPLRRYIAKPPNPGPPWILVDGTNTRQATPTDIDPTDPDFAGFPVPPGTIVDAASYNILARKAGIPEI